ncbi:MAG: hypothetical protein E2P02_21605 [Acidobacteria bacterium]|nr:MAG: hypothetical protein E2P02_21605 [Acidobacteriota bacterium]
MLTGRKAFTGKSQASLIGAIMNAEPAAPSTLFPMRPKALDHVVQTCLAKDPDERWSTAGDVGRELSWIRESHEERASVEVTSPRRSRERILWAGALLVVGLTAGLALFKASSPQLPEPVTRLVIDLPPEHRLVDSFHPIAFAPDGASLVYAATAAGAADSQLFLHRLDRFEAEAIPDTVGARDPFFSPDGQWVGFLAGSAL